MLLNILHFNKHFNFFDQPNNEIQKNNFYKLNHNIFPNNFIKFNNLLILFIKSFYLKHTLLY